jgi:prolyl oligopeptidase
MRTTINRLITLTLLLAPAAPARAQENVYPKTAKVEHVDDKFGTRVAEPYRWLEDDTATAVRKWD